MLIFTWTEIQHAVYCLFCLFFFLLYTSLFPHSNSLPIFFRLQYKMPETDRSDPSEFLKFWERKQCSHPILLDQTISCAGNGAEHCTGEPWNKTHKAIESKTICIVLSAVAPCKCTESCERLWPEKSTKNYLKLPSYIKDLTDLQT